MRAYINRVMLMLYILYMNYTTSIVQFNVYMELSFPPLPVMHFMQHKWGSTRLMAAAPVATTGLQGLPH